MSETSFDFDNAFGPETVDPVTAPVDPAKPAKPRRKQSPRRSAPSRGKAQVRSVVERTIKLIEAPQQHRQTLARLLGVDADDLAGLVVASMSATARATRPLDELVRLAAITDDVDRVVACIDLALDPALLRPAWALMSDHLPSQVPAAATSAGRSLSDVLSDISGVELEDLRASASLLG